MRSITRWCGGLCLALIAAAGANGAETGLAWNPNPETNIAGYEVLVGKVSGTWERTLPTGNVTTYRVTGLESATLYYFSVRAVSTDGLKSLDATPITHTTEAGIPTLDRTGWTVTASSEEPAAGNGVSKATDDNPATFWHTKWQASPPPPPHYFKAELPSRATLSALRYVPRQDPYLNGHVTAYEVELSDDGVAWVQAATGTWANDKTNKRADIGLRPARFVRLWGNDPYMAAAEIYLDGTYDPVTSVTLTAGMESSVDMVGWTRLYTTEGPALDKQFFRLFFHRSDGQRVNAIYTVEPKP